MAVFIQLTGGVEMKEKIELLLFISQKKERWKEQGIGEIEVMEGVDKLKIKLEGCNDTIIIAFEYAEIILDILEVFFKRGYDVGFKDGVVFGKDIKKKERSKKKSKKTNI